MGSEWDPPILHPPNKQPKDPCTYLRAHGAAAGGRARVDLPALDGLALGRLAVRADAPQAEAVRAVGEDPEAAGDGLRVSVCVGWGMVGVGVLGHQASILQINNKHPPFPTHTTQRLFF